MEPQAASATLLFLFVSLLCCLVESRPSDAEALLDLKSAIDPLNSLPWQRGEEQELCSGWRGVKECTPNGRVTKLVLELLNLTGALSPGLLAPLDQIRVLSLKSNALSGALPDFSALTNLKSLYLNDNSFSGRIPASLSTLHRLKIVILSNNLLSGPIPTSLSSLPRLYALLLQDNRLSGDIPAFNQRSLRYFNVCNNDLTGPIPVTRALSRFNLSSFLNNPRLCGDQVGRPCSESSIFPPSVSPEPSTSSTLVFSPALPPSKKRSKKRLIEIVAGSVCGFLLLSILALVVVFMMSKRKNDAGHRSRGVAGEGNKKGRGVGEGEEDGGTSGGGGGKGGVFSWEGEGQGRLVFVGGAGEMYGMEELLRASAETLGRGTVGSTYKAVMESGYIVTVKRLRDPAHGADDFRRRAEELGALHHPNLVPLRAYFHAKDERLLVYDYFPNGSLLSLIHGSRPSGSGKPLHWTSCLKIAEDVAAGLLYLHQSSPGMVHGNLKSSNVLLGPDFESCLTDYGLVPPLRPADPLDDPGPAASLFYRAPESRPPRRAFTQQSDVYSFGVLLLELLTGKTPFQDLVEEHGANIPRWVRAVREEETESGDDPASGNEASEEKLNALLHIAMACVALEPESRPGTKEVVKMVRDTRAEALVSSNSSDHSPGRWSDTVQSLPREYGSEHSNFAERD